MGSDPRSEHVIDLVDAALACDPASRAAFLAEACADDAALRREVESLVDFEQPARGFLETPAFAVDLAAFPDDAGGELAAGETIGDCRIVSLLGVGGMGEVYLADDTALGRRVAVKLLRRGVGGETIIRRFQHERRVLAGLNHPHIARLYGGAVSADGRPYLVMEYVEGDRLDQYCDRHQLSVADRLALFRKVCSAVAYAHQNLVIHRDLKPGNILVTRDGEPKLLDFGIAKLLDPEATQGGPELTVTMFGAMTPGYASPEQVRGDPISTASDVYSLGVVLYELLTAQRPHRTTSRNSTELSRVLESQTVARPSTAVARAAADPHGRTPACGESPERLRRHLAGDLDNIVLMAMRAEPARRYVSVSQFSEDIRRHCDGKPVVARKDTLGYRVSKFVGRNKAVAAAGILLFLSLLAGVIATTRQATRADRRFNDVRQLANAILFEVDPLLAKLPGSIPARTALVRHALDYLDSLSQEAGSDRDLSRDLATAYEKVGDVQGNPGAANVGDIKGALVSYGKARELRQALVKADPRNARQRHELANNEEQTGYILWWLNQTDRAVASYNDALALRKTLLAEQPRSADFRHGMAYLEMRIGDVPAWNNDTPHAMAAYNVALPLLEGLAAEQPANTDAQIAVARCLHRMGDTLKEADDFNGSLACLTRAQAIVEPIFRRDPNAYDAESELWFVLFKRCESFLEHSDGAQAALLGPQTVSLAEDLVRREPHDTGTLHKLANSHDYLAQAYLVTGRDAEAIAEFGKSLDIDTDLCAKSPDTGDYQRACSSHRNGIAKAQQHLGRWDEALANEQAAVETLVHAQAADPGDQMIRHDLADVQQQIGRIQGRAGPSGGGARGVSAGPGPMGGIRRRRTAQQER